MPRPRSLKPSYCLDRTHNRAFVTIDSQRRYLGPYGSQESRDAYDRLVGEWIALGRPRGIQRPAEEPLKVNDVILRFWAHAQTEYPSPPFAAGKRPGGELGNYFDALRPLRRLYGPTPVLKFGPKALAVVRDEMIRMGWCRNYLNRQISRLKHVFKWAAADELIPGSVFHGLSALSGLRRGRSAARETNPVKPVAQGDINLIVQVLPPRLAAMVRVQLLAAMRPDELCSMRTCDIETNLPGCWIYRPEHHKTEHHGHAREIRLGPEAQDALRPFLKADLQAYIFSPLDAEADRLAERHARRNTPLTWGNVPGSNKASKRRRPPGTRYTTTSYRRAIYRACDAADKREKAGRVIGNQERLVPRWHPHQLRHTRGTVIRKDYGLDAARAVLGHKSAAMTEIYAELDFAKADQVMSQIG